MMRLRPEDTALSFFIPIGIAAASFAAVWCVRRARRRGAARFDPACLDRLAEDLGPETFADVTDMFLASLDERRAHLEAAIGAGDAEGIRREVHTLSGSAGACGLIRLSAACRRVEALLCAGDRDAALAAARRTVARIARDAPLLRAYLKDRPPA